MSAPRPWFNFSDYLKEIDGPHEPIAAPCHTRAAAADRRIRLITYAAVAVALLALTAVLVAATQFAIGGLK